MQLFAFSCNSDRKEHMLDSNVSWAIREIISPDKILPESPNLRERERFMRSFSLFRTNKWFSLKSVPVSPAMDGRHIICLPEAKSWINQVCSKKDNVDLIHYIHENCLLEKEDLIIRKYICKQLCIYPLQSILHH